MKNKFLFLGTSHEHMKVGHWHTSSGSRPEKCLCHIKVFVFVRQFVPVLATCRHFLSLTVCKTEGVKSSHVCRKKEPRWSHVALNVSCWIVFPLARSYKYTSVCFIWCFYLSPSPAEELRRTPCVSALNYWRRSLIIIIIIIIWIRVLDNLSVQVFFFFFFCREMRCLDSPSSSTGLSGGAADVRCSRWEERLTLLFPRHHHPTLVELHGARREALSPARRQPQEAATASPPLPLPQERSRATGSKRPAGSFFFF